MTTITDLSKKAYKIGYDAAVNDGACIFAQNSDAMVLIEGLKPGQGSSTIIVAFNNGVNDAINDILLDGEE